MPCGSTRSCSCCISHVGSSVKPRCVSGNVSLFQGNVFDRGGLKQKIQLHVEVCMHKYASRNAGTCVGIGRAKLAFTSVVGTRRY